MVRPYTHVGACGSLLQEEPEMGGTVGDERSGGLQASRMINHAWDRTGDEGDSKCRWEPLRRATAQNLEGVHGPNTDQHQSAAASGKWSRNGLWLLMLVLQRITRTIRSFESRDRRMTKITQKAKRSVGWYQ